MPTRPPSASSLFSDQLRLFFFFFFTPFEFLVPGQLHRRPWCPVRSNREITYFVMFIINCFVNFLAPKLDLRKCKISNSFLLWTRTSQQLLPLLQPDRNILHGRSCCFLKFLTFFKNRPVIIDEAKAREEKRKELEVKKVELQQRMADANAAIGLWKKCRDVLHQKESALRVRLANVQAGEKMLHYVLNQDQIVKAQSMVRRWLKRKHDSKEKRKEFVFFVWTDWTWSR